MAQVKPPVDNKYVGKEEYMTQTLPPVDNKYE